ncbi:MAG: S1 RNA-binding domain-containing protein [Candidatus Cloacimonetes bacterium]|nr:S1 RNA-binding domain-containing protein [Candidatus Cloacimonadota bacterium]
MVDNTQETTPEKDINASAGTNNECCNDEKVQKNAQPEENSHSENNEENFAQMLEESLGKSVDLELGDEISGEIINISDDYIFVSLGGKLDAYADKNEYLDADGEFSLKVGDTLKGFIVKKTDSETIISKSFNKSYANKELLRDAYDKKIPVNGKVMSAIKGGFTVDLLGIRAFCPVSQLDIRRINDVSLYIGRTFDFEIMEYAENGKNIVVTRVPILQKEQEEIKKKTWEKIEVGAVLEGVVTRITDFGAFVDLGGVEGLLHISEISWGRVENCTEVINIREKIQVKIIKISGEKISLSMKALQMNPFDEYIQTVREGDVVKGKIVRIENFGSVIELKHGVEGLIPISEMTSGRRIGHPSEMLTVGDTVEAEIIRVKVEEKKISLSLKSLEPNVWDDIDSILEVGNDYEGVIENVTPHGAFIKLHDSIVGLLPKSRIAKAGLKIPISDIGTTLNVRVIEIDKEKKRISLESTVTASAEKIEVEGDSRDNWKRYARNKSQDNQIDSPFKDL